MEVLPVLFPACAGVIPILGSLEYDILAFPRVCGGDPAGRGQCELAYYFSPRVRG